MADVDGTPTRPRRIGRSIGAVFAGILAIVVLDMGIDHILHTSGIFPPYGESMADGLFLLALGYRIVDSIVGTFLTASLAPSRPLRHALILGAIGVVLSSLGALATIAAGPELGPTWYPLTLVAVALPCAYVGGKLAERRRQATLQPVLA